jgi:hypothetical protein
LLRIRTPDHPAQSLDAIIKELLRFRNLFFFHHILKHFPSSELTGTRKEDSFSISAYKELKFIGLAAQQCYSKCM